MSVKTASKLVTRVMRVAITETIAPATQGAGKPSRRPLDEVVKVNGQFGQALHQRLNAYTGSIDEHGNAGSTVDSWRSALSGRGGSRQTQQ